MSQITVDHLTPEKEKPGHGRLVRENVNAPWDPALSAGNNNRLLAEYEQIVNSNGIISRAG